jgi:hypothetical protein
VDGGRLAEARGGAGSAGAQLLSLTGEGVAIFGLDGGDQL